jgi:hypothetical protein
VSSKVSSGNIHAEPYFKRLFPDELRGTYGKLLCSMFSTGSLFFYQLILKKYGSP